MTKGTSKELVEDMLMVTMTREGLEKEKEEAYKLGYFEGKADSYEYAFEKIFGEDEV